MSDTTSLPLSDAALFKRQALAWAAQFPVLCLLDSNGYSHDPYTSTDWLLAIDAIKVFDSPTNSFEGLAAFHSTSTERIFGYLGYDLKNQIENLSSSHPDGIGFTSVYFFRPRYIIEIKDGKAIFNRNYPEAFDLYERIMNFILTPHSDSLAPITLKGRTPKDKYIANVDRIKQQIGNGDFYEMNYCCEWYAENTTIDLSSVFEALNSKARAPFSAYFKLLDKYLLCASPERFLRKSGVTILSQPIKGTIKKGTDANENVALQHSLLHNEKERAENVMIVDLVRNDLAKSAQTGSVKVLELFGIYEFATVNQMISTVTATAREGINPIDIIRNAFPMGSMTGAPKVEVMKMIEAYEDQKRGLYSGAVGYFTPAGDFDFNVVIRSIFYNEASKYLSIQVGSAITYDANAASEYEELLLKAKGMIDALGASI